MNETIKKINELAKNQPWNHSIDLGQGLFTSDPRLHKRDGTNIVKWERLKKYIDTVDWNNKIVFDVGASDGFFTVEMAKRGAKVYSLEVNLNRLKKLNFVIKKLNIQKKVTVIDQNIYELNFDDLPKFDLVICMGFLHRVPDFYSVMNKLSKISENIVYEWKAQIDYSYEKSIIMFDGKSSDINDNFVTCYFTPNLFSILKISSSLGMNYFKIISDKRRSMIVVSKNYSNDFNHFSLKMKISIFSKLKNFIFRILREFKYFIK